jgi:spermidine synthase
MATAIQPLWDNQSFAFGLFRMQSMTPNSFKGPQAMRFKLEHLFYRDGPTASTSVLPNKHLEAKMLDLSIQVNGKTDGNTFADFYTMQLLGHIPVLFSEKAENVCVIGFGTGMTAGAVAQYHEVAGIDLIEINPMVIQAGKLFVPANYNVLENNKVHVHQTDAMRFLRTTGKNYHVIISEPSNPWMAGVANLFSRDFYELAINRLTDKGVFMQWFHGYSLSTETLKLILNTFRSVFPHYFVLNLQDNDYAILGTKQAITDETLKRVHDKLAKEAANPALRSLGLDKTEQILAMEVLSEISIDTLAEGGGLHTLENPKLDYWAGLDFFTDASINVEQLNNEISPETRLPSLLSLWTKHTGDNHEVAYPDTFCRFNATLCNKFMRRNSPAEKLSQNQTPSPPIKID